ncbi:unnamed protein product [Musa acuminata subsp. malaccensis]|uniref:(wild Malaysian banana) hypothetical protein n=1 Tax=Musa acuminata subsp. malaccensis TaxID=214687 RepID=A0A8D7F6Z2_MUSAM|nr:unnamed protein product [Musa acuminata subsp. malaccensis]
MVFFLLLLLPLLVAGQLAGLNHARTVSREVEKQKSERSAPSSMGQFPKISPSQEHDDAGDDEFSQTYGVSKRLVPQGPNPLHN